MRALSIAMPAERRLLRSDGLQRWYLLDPEAPSVDKLLAKQLSSQVAADARALEQWFDVAARNADLRHAACTEIEHWGMHEGAPYIVSAYPAGRSLSELLPALRAGGPRATADLVAEVGAQVLDALDYVQGEQPGLTHLDLDVDTIRVRPTGQCVLPEFGLWSVLPPAEVSRCRFDSGRVQFCSPELVESRPTDQRSDIFSLGVLLYQLLTGESPFAGATQLVIAMAIADGKRGSLRERAPGVPEHVREIVEVMLATQADERFHTAAAARAALASTLTAPRAELQARLAAAFAAPAVPPASGVRASRSPATQMMTSPFADASAAGKPALRPGGRTQAFVVPRGAAPSPIPPPMTGAQSEPVGARTISETGGARAREPVGARTMMETGPSRAAPSQAPGAASDAAASQAPGAASGAALSQAPSAAWDAAASRAPSPDSEPAPPPLFMPAAQASAVHTGRVAVLSTPPPAAAAAGPATKDVPFAAAAAAESARPRAPSMTQDVPLAPGHAVPYSDRPAAHAVLATRDVPLAVGAPPVAAKDAVSHAAGASNDALPAAARGASEAPHARSDAARAASESPRSMLATRDVPLAPSYAPPTAQPAHGSGAHAAPSSAPSHAAHAAPSAAHGAAARTRSDRPAASLDPSLARTVDESPRSAVLAARDVPLASQAAPRGQHAMLATKDVPFAPTYAKDQAAPRAGSAGAPFAAAPQASTRDAPLPAFPSEPHRGRPGSDPAPARELRVNDGRTAHLRAAPFGLSQPELGAVEPPPMGRSNYPFHPAFKDPGGAAPASAGQSPSSPPQAVIDSWRPPPKAEGRGDGSASPRREPSAPAWSTPPSSERESARSGAPARSRGDKWRDPSETVFQMKSLRPKGLAGGGKPKTAVLSLLLISMILGFAAVVAIYFAYRLF